jgi:hypothetical protein
MGDINSRQDLIDYALRRLGGGVINIEVSADQLDDRVQDALDYYHEYHFDGIERDFLVRKITGTKITVPSTVGFSVGNKVSVASKGIYAQIIEINGNVINISKIIGPPSIVFAAGDTMTSDAGGSVVITSVSLGDVDKGYIPADEGIMSVIRVLNLSGVFTSGDYLFNSQYQIMMNEMQNITSGGTQYLYGMLNYLGNLDFILKKEKDFRFNRRMGKLFLDINWTTDIAIGDYVAVEVYRAIDDDTYSEILNDRWLKEYTTALIKTQWGENLSKYTGLVLPGGLQYDGKAIKQEGMAEVEKLRIEAISSGAPLAFIVG